MTINPVFVSGTWDFKWPQGKKLRFAFQELPNQDGIASWLPEPVDEKSVAARAYEPLRRLWPVWEAQGAPGTPEHLEELINQFETIAGSWLVRMPGITFDFGSKGSRYLLPPPGFGTRGELKLESGFDGNDQPPSYDVLVSFMPLPVVLTGQATNRTPGTTEPETITGQVSVLGSYATRLPTGVPTTLVGPNVNFLDLEQRDPLGSYFGSPEYKQIVVHEVGHILGFAHEHQSPLYREAFAQLNPTQPLKLKATEELRTSVFNVLARKLSTEFGPGLASAVPPTKAQLDKLDEEVTRELASEWPHLPVAELGSVPLVPFSDWREWRGELTDRYQSLDSVMAHPGWTNTLAGSQPLSIAAAASSITKPTDTDLDALDTMYPSRGRLTTQSAS